MYLAGHIIARFFFYIVDLMMINLFKMNPILGFFLPKARIMEGKRYF